MEVLLVCLLLASICVLILILHQKRKLEKELLEAKQIAEGITSADDYAKQKQSEADDYAKQKQSEADDYAKHKFRAADTYHTRKQLNANRILNEAKKKVDELKNMQKVLESERDALVGQLSVLELDCLVGMVRIDTFKDMKSDEVKNNLSLLRKKQDDLIKSDEAAIGSYSSEPKKYRDNQKKQILRCFNAECAHIIDSVTVKNIDTARSKIMRSFEATNKIFSAQYLKIEQAYLDLKLQELSLVYAYMLKEDEERERRKEIREQMAEEEKVRREIEREKLKIEKEETQFSNEIKKLMDYMQKSKDDIERQLYINKINELEEKLKRVEADKADVFNREQNTRAGFVYVISNVGSFGEDIYKIGMTRRLDPMDRISELSSASVPFIFDVHAMIFSDDAPALETLLHKTFQEHRMNKVNMRKEFFRIDLKRIKDVVKENHNATVRFIDIPDAIEYRETLEIESEHIKGNGILA